MNFPDVICVNLCVCRHFPTLYRFKRYSCSPGSYSSYVPYSASPILCQRSMELGGVGDLELERGEQQSAPENFAGSWLWKCGSTDGCPMWVHREVITHLLRSYCQQYFTVSSRVVVKTSTLEWENLLSIPDSGTSCTVDLGQATQSHQFFQWENRSTW